MGLTIIDWEFILLFAYLSCGLFAATFLRKQIPFLQKLAVPNAIVAGIIVLLLSQQVFGVFSISHDKLNHVIYHLLTGVFIALGLSRPRFKHARGVITTTLIICKSYALLAVLGIIFTLIWILLLLPDFFPSFAMLPLLGFGFDHLLASNIGLQWEQSGFLSGGWAGFSFGIVGLIWAYIGGIFLAARARRRRDGAGEASRAVLEGIIPREEDKPVGGRLTTTAEGIESFALHLALIGVVFLATFGLLNQASIWLIRYGNYGVLVGGILWSFSFVFGLLIAYLARKIIDWLDLGYLFDAGFLSRISGAMIDFLIVAAIAAIPLIMFKDYWIEIVILSVICGAAIMVFVYYLSLKMQGDYPVERAVAVFGLMTGNIASSLALLRMVDPRMETPVAEDTAFAGGLSLLVGLPVLVFINYPLTGFLLGRSVHYLLVSLGLFAGYGLLLFLVWFLWARWLLKRGGAEAAESTDQAAKG